MYRIRRNIALLTFSSVNRINEMELSKTPPPIPSIHKLIESNDDLPGTPPKLQNESADQGQKNSLSRTRSGSQPCVIPLSSHDQNAVQFKQEVGILSVFLFVFTFCEYIR